MTLRLDEAAHVYFDALRSRYFPPERLFVGAHVTMFHALPAGCEPRLLLAAGEMCRRTTNFAVSIKGLRFLGRGVAYDLTAPAASRLRDDLVGQFAGDLTRQDSARWTPHITVQNKVEPARARETMATLAGQHYAAPISAVGLAVWRYLDGPWESVQEFGFL